MADDNKYPDCEPSTLGDPKVRKIERELNTLPPPQIAWGDEYKAWPIERRLAFAEKLASSMNHACDIMQQERDQLTTVVARKEAQIKGLLDKLERQAAMIQRQMNEAGHEKQQLYRRVAELTSGAGKVRTLLLRASERNMDPDVGAAVGAALAYFARADEE